MARRRGSVAGSVAKAVSDVRNETFAVASSTCGSSADSADPPVSSSEPSSSEPSSSELDDALLLLGAAIDIFQKGKDSKATDPREKVSPVTTTVAAVDVEVRERVSSSSTADQKPEESGKRTTSDDGIKATESARRIGSLTTKERRARVDKWLKKRARMIARRKENASKKTKTMGRYVGRTKFAMSRRRVKGRFVSLKFLNERGIKFDSGAEPQSGWVCSTLGGKVFVELEDALNAVNSQASSVNQKVVGEGKEDERKKREANAAKNDEPVSNGNAKGSHRINLGLCTNFG